MEKDKEVAQVVRLCQIVYPYFYGPGEKEVIRHKVINLTAGASLSDAYSALKAVKGQLGQPAGDITINFTAGIKGDLRLISEF